MDTADRFVDWLANNELVGWALVITVAALLIVGTGKLLASRLPNIPPPQQDEHATHRFI